jgi:hypothetical protein
LKNKIKIVPSFQKIKFEQDDLKNLNFYIILKIMKPKTLTDFDPIDPEYEEFGFKNFGKREIEEL